LLAYIIFGKNINKESENNNANTGNNTSDVVTLDINSSEIQELTKFVRNMNSNYDWYIDEMLNAFNIENSNHDDNKMGFVAYYLELNEYKDKKTINNDMHNLYIKEKDMENKFREIFGPDVVYTNRTFKEDNCNITSEYNSKTKQYSGCYNCCSFFGGDYRIFFELYNAEQKDDEIYTYWHLYEGNYFDRYDGNSNSIMEGYKDYTLSPLNNSELKEEFTCTTCNESNISLFLEEDFENINYLINKIKSRGKIDTYKITYKKQSDGKYYVYSGEWM
ncbi:MAG: hypothetical protein NC181_05145, partial [Clostridium sp.]|nr:hypothetical protein [Clostridium sp.]MCM1443943.1 hypothetical protein [Candidatus Amulumruptor caecigallinarius]